MVAYVSNPSSWEAEKETDMAGSSHPVKGTPSILKFFLRPHPTVEPQAEHSLQNTGL